MIPFWTVFYSLSKSILSIWVTAFFCGKDFYKFKLRNNITIVIFDTINFCIQNDLNLHTHFHLNRYVFFHPVSFKVLYANSAKNKFSCTLPSQSRSNFKLFLDDADDCLMDTWWLRIKWLQYLKQLVKILYFRFL